jgi:phosphoribosylaminoimidazole-succinocarboxamide synthase
MKDEWIETISNRYIELFEKLIGEKFIPQKLSDEETEKRINKAIDQLNDQQIN